MVGVNEKSACMPTNNAHAIGASPMEKSISNLTHDEDASAVLQRARRVLGCVPRDGSGRPTPLPWRHSNSIRMGILRRLGSQLSPYAPTRHHARTRNGSQCQPLGLYTPDTRVAPSLIVTCLSRYPSPSNSRVPELQPRIETCAPSLARQPPNVQRSTIERSTGSFDW